MSSSGSSDTATATAQSTSQQSSSIDSTSSPATTSTVSSSTTSTPEPTTTPASSTTTDSPTTSTPITSSTEPTTTSSSTPSSEPTTTTSDIQASPSSTQQDTPTPSTSTTIVISTPTAETTTAPNGSATTILRTTVFTVTPPSSSTLSTSRIATTSSSSSSSAISSTSATAAPVSGKHGIGTGGTIAIAITVPLVSVVLLGLLAAFLWKRHQKKKANEEMRRKEVEDYTYNPNNDTSGHSGILAAGSNSGMSEAEGYRGWGNTAGTRKVSAPLSSSPSAGTALSPVPFGASHSDNGFGNNEMQHDTKIQPAELYGGTPQAELYGGSAPATSPQSPTFAHNQKRHSQAPLLVMPHRPSTADSSTIGAGAVHSPVEVDDGLQRGVSNASSRYTNATHDTEGSDGDDVQYPPANQTAHYYANEAPTYYDETNNNNNNIRPQEQYNHYNQYAPMQEQEQQQRPPMIQEVSARRNTRIETPTENHYPLSSHQGNSGIAQNF